MALIEVRDLTVDLPVYSTQARSLRRSVMKLSTGGRLMRSDDRVIIRAISGASFTLERGDRLGLVGHNGSGKSTLLRTLAGIYKPTSGTVRLDGSISAALDPMMGLELEANGETNIIALARYRGASRKEALAALPAIADLSELGPFLDLPVKSYSAGMLARLSFAVATSFEPDILLMDEWINAADHAFVHKARAHLQSYFDQAKAVVLATHDYGIIQQLCNKVLVLENGVPQALGSPTDLLAA
ncbi:ATP-binding cassette domain-containing protein [Phenylobacterium sp. LjRoot219]|uniref:ABC transporter ATP-binding protein n=1 Tax=Phenylobacterium sp. LjRoot219 TaxID=3342283 RepID=UPI003ECF91BC